MNDLFTILIAIGVCAVIIIVLRDLSLWYWKINTMLKNQETAIALQNRTNKLLKDQIELMRSQLELTIGPDSGSIKTDDPTDNQIN